MWDWYVRHGAIPRTDLYYKTVPYPCFIWMCNPATCIWMSLAINECKLVVRSFWHTSRWSRDKQVDFNSHQQLFHFLPGIPTVKTACFSVQNIFLKKCLLFVCKLCTEKNWWHLVSSLTCHFIIFDNCTNYTKRGFKSTVTKWLVQRLYICMSSSLTLQIIGNKLCPEQDGMIRIVRATHNHVAFNTIMCYSQRMKATDQVDISRASV